MVIFVKFKEHLKRKLYASGLKLIQKNIPEDSWRNEYARLRLWYVCSNKYTEEKRDQFALELQKYQPKTILPKFLLKFDYWLCWIFLGAEPSEYFEYSFFKKGWPLRNQHITEVRMEFLDPKLNEEENFDLLYNKSCFYNHWDKFLNRKWCIPQKVTLEEFQTLFGGLSRIIVKPTSQYGGIGIYTIDLMDANLADIYDQLHSAEEEIVAEEYIYQKGVLHEINPSSLNHIRVVTLRNKDNVDVLGCFFAAGRQGSITSNFSGGGLDAVIDIKTGRLGQCRSLDKTSFQKHPDTGIEITGRYIPDWERIKEFACEAHLHGPDNLRMIGWDICWSDGNLSLIEGNRYPGLPSLTRKSEKAWKKITAFLDDIFSN